ncbi:uncharacterized protein LOC124275877 isoform X2 [Haliotis rubra]|uniref:uncharacterized protein LOC124275877 isoform X2 n=1 Tax=Haliotis rubra TaxID=36100 RepID=UPI001EE6153C|nr:uncharacterized protein LOC124275877 isoform X2 [Haliotis rubra]
MLIGYTIDDRGTISQACKHFGGISKMVATYIFLICVVSCVVAQDPRKCCLPNSWQAYTAQGGRLNQDPLPYSIFYSDFTLKKEAQQEMLLKPGSAPVAGFRTVTDHNKRKTYRISPAGKCTSFANPVPMIACIPDSATFLGRKLCWSPQIRYCL